MLRGKNTMPVPNSTTDTILTASVIMLGDVKVGKTGLLDRYVNKNFEQTYEPTIGVGTMSKTVLIDNRSVRIRFWDTNGQEKYNSLPPSYFRSANCCVLVFDLTSPENFENITLWKDQTLIQANPTDPKHFPFVLLGNKIDLFQERMVRPKIVKAWCEENNNTPYFEVSAKDGINVDEAFGTIAGCALEHKERTNRQFSKDFIGSIRLDDQMAAQKQQKKQCCQNS